MKSNCSIIISHIKNDVKDFEQRKPIGAKLAEKYSEVGASFEDNRFLRWADNVENCSTYLEFYRFEKAGLKLKSANFCKDRLCAMCNWRRSLRTFAKISRIIQSESFTGAGYKNLFLTLTVENCGINELHESLKKLLYSFEKFLKNKRIKKVVKGYFRALEITYNAKTRTFHPHLHLILAVPKSYFTTYYISQADFTAIWQKSLAVNYTPIVDIRKFTGNKGIAEASKYCIKADNKFLNSIGADALFVLRSELMNLRLLGLGGIFRKIAAELKVQIDDNIVDGDDLPNNDILIEILKFRWVVGLKNYEIFETEKVGF